MFYSVEADMANYRDKSSQPSKLDGCVNQHRHKITKDLLYHGDEDSLDYCKLKGIVTALMKYIEDAPMKLQYSIDFAKDVRKKLLCLHYDISRFLKHHKEFPFSSELHNLLVRYVEFEHEILYHPKNFSKEYQKVVEQQILYLLQSIFYDPIGIRKNLLSSPEEASAINSLYILKNLKPEIKKSQSLIESMMMNLLTKLNVLDEINEMKRKDSDLNFDKILKVSRVQKLHKYLTSRNYYNKDDFHNSDDEFDMEIVEDIKQEIKVERNQSDNIELIITSNQQCITIDLDSDSDDCHSLDVRKNTLDSNIKRAHTTTNISKRQLNSFTTSNICDNKRFHLNSDKFPVLNLCDNENRCSNSSNHNLSNSKSAFLHNKIQNGTTRRNVVNEANSDQDTSLHNMIYDDLKYNNFQLKKELLLLDNDEHLCIPSKLYDVTEKLKRYIDECPKSIRYTKRFVNGIHRTLIYLYESMCRLVKGNREFLLSTELHALLVTYFELEYEVLYDSKNFSTQYEEIVQSRILHLFVNILFNPTVDRSIKEYVKSSEEASLLSTLYVVRSIKPEYKKQHPLVEKILNKLMSKLNVLDKINELKSKNKNVEFHQLLTIPQFNKIYKYLHYRDCYGMACNSSEDSMDMVEVKPSIKNEEIDVKPDVGTHYHLDKRKPLVIDVDEEDDDCFMVCDIGTQRNETVVKTEENSSQNLFDNVLIKAETNCNNSEDYSASNLCNNNQNNACIIIDDSDEEEGNCLLEKSNPTVTHVSNITDALEEELLQLEDADSDIKSEDENEVLNRFTDDECDTNEKIGKSCNSVQKNIRSGSSNKQTIILDQQLTSEEVKTSNDTNKTNDRLLQNVQSIEVLENTVSHSCSSTENIDTMTSEEIHKSMNSLSLTNNEINYKMTESNNCSSETTVDLHLISHVNINSEKNLANNFDIGEATNTSLKSANDNLAIEKDIHFLTNSTSILNISSNTESLSLSRNDVSEKNSEIEVLHENNSNIKIPNIVEIHHTTSILEEKDSTSNIQDSSLQLNVEVDKVYENDVNLKAVNDDIQVQHSTSNAECIEEFNFTSRAFSKNLNEPDKSDDFNLEIDDSHNKNCELQKDDNSKTSMLSNEENIVQDNQLTEIDQQIYNKPPEEFAEIIQVSENKNLNIVGDEISVTPENSDLVESEVVLFQDKNVENVSEDTQLLENEINTTSKGLELSENEESIIVTDLEKKVEVICDKSDLSEKEEQRIVATDYDKEVIVTAESINTIEEKEVHLACEEDSESIVSEVAIVQTENEESDAVSTVHEHSIEHEQQSIVHTEFQVFCEALNSNENAELNTIEHLKGVHTEVNVVADDLKEELCVLDDQTAQSKKDTIEDLQLTVVEHLEVQKVIEVTCENEEILEDEPNASKSSFNFQDNDYVKETNYEDIIEDDATQALNIEIQDSIANDDNKDCKEGLKSNITFNNRCKNNKMLEDEPTTSKSSFNFQDNDYVKETTNNEDIIEDDGTQELHIEIQDPVVNDDDNEECKESLKSNVTFDNPSNFLGVLAQVASEQRKLDSLEMENKNKRKGVTKKTNFNKRKQNVINKKKLKKGSVAVKRVTRSSSLKAKENLDVEADFCKFPSNFMNLENFVSPPPNRIYDLILPIASTNEESIDGSDCDQINQQFGDTQLNTFLINNSIFDEDTIEDGIEFVCHKKNNKIETSISKCNEGIHPVQEIHDDNIFNIESKSKSHHLQNLEDISLNFQIKTSETFTRRDINKQFNVNLLLNRDEENKSLKAKSKPSASKKSKKIKSNLKCAELCINNEELDFCRNVKTTSNKNKRSKLEQNAEKTLNKTNTKNQKLCSDGVSIKTKRNKSSVDEVHIPYEKTEEIIVQNIGIENVTEAELEFEVITEETYESSDLQINAEITDPNNGEVENDIVINKNSVISDIDLSSSSNSVTSKNHEEECSTDNILKTFEKVEIESATNNVSNNFQKQTNTKLENENLIDLKTQKKDFIPENNEIERHEEIVDNEQLKLNKSTKLRKSKVIKGHSKERKTTQKKYKDDKKKNELKIIEESTQAKISDSPLPNVKNMQPKNMKTNKQKLLKSNKFQCSSRSNIKKYIAKNNLSKKLGISKKNKSMITKKRIKFLRESLKRTVRRDRIKREYVDNLKREQVEVRSNIEIPKVNRDKNHTETLIKAERTKKKRQGKKALLKGKFLIEENWICSPIEQELSKIVIDMPLKPSENSIEDTTITKNNQELNLETDLNVSNNIQVNSALIENDCIDKVTEHEELTNTEKDKVQVLENVMDNFDYEEVIEQPKILKSIESETIRIEDQLTDAEEPSKDIKSTTVDGCAAVTECITKVISDVDVQEEPCDDIQNTIAVKNSNVTIEEPDNTTLRNESTNIHEESSIDELLKNDLPSMSTLVEEIKTKKRKLSESEHVQDQEEQFATKEPLVIQPQIQSCKIKSKTSGKFSKRILRSSKTDSKSKDINSVTEKLRSRNYQKIKRNTTEGTKTLENLDTTKSDPMVKFAEKIEMSAKILKEENTEIVRIDDKRNRVKKQANTTSEITEVDDNKINSKVEKEANTNFEITKADDDKANMKVEKEVMMTDGNESNREVEIVINTTSEITEIDYNIANQEINKTCEIIESDNKNTNKEVEEEPNLTSEITKVDDKIIESDNKNTNKTVEEEPNLTSEITKVDDNTEIDAISEITNVNDNKTSEEIEESYTTSEEPNNIKSSTFIEINVGKINGDELEESNTTFAGCNELKKNELMQIVEVGHTVINDNISKEDDTITQNSNLKLVAEVDKNETNEKLVTEVETILPLVEEDNEEVVNETFENTKENCIEIAEVDHVKINSKSPDETNTTNCIEIAEADIVKINCKLLDETNITKCIEIAKTDNFEINSTSADETNITNGKEITETDDLKIIINSADEMSTNNGMEIAEAEDLKINSKLPDETNTTSCMEGAEADDVEIYSKPPDEINITTSVESDEADNVNLNNKSLNETNAIDGMETFEGDDVNINSKSPDDTNITFKYSKITEDNSNNKINEKILEDTSYKNLNKFGKDLVENSDLENNVMQFSMDLEETSKDTDNLPSTVEEINMLSESADNDNRDHKINEQDLKSNNESLNEDNMLDVHGDAIKESDNYCEKVVETEQDLTSDQMEMHKEISKECENFDKEECKNATEVQKDFSSNDFEFPKNLNENVADIEIQPTKNFVSSPTETLHASPKNDYSVTNESEYAIEEVTIQSSILSPKHLQHIVDSVKNIPTTEILEEIVDCHGLLNSKCFQDSILVYSEQMKEPMDDNCLLQIANETTVETSQVTPSTSLSDTSPNFLQAMFSHQFQIGKILYLKGSDHNYHSVSDPLLSAKYGTTNENDRSLNHSKEIALPTPELESEDNIMNFISTQSEGNLNQELSTSLNETSVNTSTDFQLLDQCLMENGLGHESSPPLPQRVSCDNVFQNTLNQEVTEYDEISRNSNLEFRESNEEVNIDSFQQNEMSTEKMIELMSVLADIKHLNNISSGAAPFDAELNNYNQQYKLQYPDQMQKSYEDVSIATNTLNKDFGDTSDASGFTNKSSSELQESPTKLIRDIFEAASAIEHSNSIPISKSISFDTDFYFSGIQDTFSTRDKTSNNKVIVERIPHIPHELAKCTNVVDISAPSKDNEFKTIDVHHTVNIPKISVTTPKKKSLTSSESHPKFALQLQPKINKSNMDKLLLDHCLKRQSTRTKLVAPKKKQLNEVPKKPEILNAKTNNEFRIETINKVKMDKDESSSHSCNELDLKKISGRRVSGKTRIVNDITKDGKCNNTATTSKKEDMISKKEDESKTVKNFNKEVTSYLKDLDKLVVEHQNTTKENGKKSVVKSGCTTTDSHSQTINFTISPPQQKVKDNFDQALSKNDLLDNVKFRKRKPVDYVEKSERKKNCYVNKKLPYKGNQKKVELEDSNNKAKGKRKLEQPDDKDVKIKNKYHETEENKLPNLSDNLLQEKEKSFEDLDNNISRKKKPRLSLPESNPTDAVFDRLLKEGNVNDNDISNSSINNYSNRNPVSLPTYEHFTPIIQNADPSMINLQKSTSNSISIFNTGVQRTTDNKPKKIAIVAPIKSNVKKEPPPMCSRSLYNRSEDYHNMKGHHLYYASSSSSKSRHHYSSRESSRSRHPESSSSRRREYQIDRKQPSSRTNKTSEHDWLDKMKHAFPQEFTNEVSFEYERGNDISRSTHQH